MSRFTVKDIILKLNPEIDCVEYTCTLKENKIITKHKAIAKYVSKINMRFNNKIDRNSIDDINRLLFCGKDYMTKSLIIYINFNESKKDKIYLYYISGFSDNFINTYENAYQYSFLRFLLNKFFEEDIINEKVHLNDYLLLKTREYVQYIIKTVDPHIESVSSLFDQINYISTLTYEGLNVSSKLVIMDKKLIDLFINYYIELEIPIDFKEHRKIRKLLETSDKNIYLIGDSNKIYGLGKFTRLNKLQYLLKKNRNVFIFDFVGKFEYKINTIFISNSMIREKNNEEFVKWILNENNLVKIKYGKPNLIENIYSETILKNAIEKVFQDSFRDNNKNIEILKKIINYAKNQKHGTIVVITPPDVAKKEVAKFKNQSINIKEKQFNIDDPYLESLIYRVTSIDGAIYIDINGCCHAIGVILDGMADEDHGDSSRGARYNSAIKYSLKPSLNKKCLIVVISEDGMTNLIHNGENYTNIDKRVNKLINKFIGLYNQNNFEEALEIVEEAIELDEKNCKLFFAKGAIESKLNNLNKAISDYNKAVVLKPDDSDVYYNRANFYSNLGENEKALNDYNKAIELKPDDSLAYNNRGILYSKIGEKDKALIDYDKAIELKPDYIEAYNNRAILLRELGEKEKALNDYNKAIELNPDDALAYNNRGILYSELGEKKKALNDYNKAIELNPDDALAYNNRGTLYSELGEKERAFNDYHKAIKLRPDYVSVYNNRAVLYFELGKLNLAMEQIIKAINIDETNGYIYATLADINLKKKEIGKFYKNMELALNYGFPVEDILSNDSYKTLINDKRFKEIIGKH